MHLTIAKPLLALPTIDYRTLNDLQGNLKDLTQANYDRLKRSLQEFGFIVPFFVWINNGKPFIADGHQRCRVLNAELMQPYNLPYIEIEAKDAQEAKKKLLVISSQYGTITQEGMDEFTFDLDDKWKANTINFDKLNFKIDTDEIAGGLTDPDEVPDVPKDPVTKKGDLWILGDHRVLCGDSTKQEDVLKLLEDNIPILMVTDPPYGVKLDQSWRNKALGDKSLGKGNSNKIASDDRIDWSDAWKLFHGDVVYVWHADKFSDIVMTSLRNSGFEICQQIIWNKTVMVMGRNDYHFKHEPCWYAIRKGKNHNWTGDRKQTTVIDASSPNYIMAGSEEERTEHPTQKPAECMRIPIQNNSKKGESVYDPFLGSGTTLIAAEQMERSCFGMEIDPLYCDVIVKRWEEFTGKKAQKIAPI